MSNPLGKFKTVDEVRQESASRGESTISVPAGASMPGYCLHCTKLSRNTAIIRLNEVDTGAMQQAKAAGCLWLGFGIGGLLGLKAAMNPAGNSLNKSSSKKREMRVTLCSSCAREFGLPSATQDGTMVTILCSEAFVRKYESGEGVDPY